MATIPHIHHSAWCSTHDYADDLDTTCRSEVQAFATLDSRSNDLDALEVLVEQYSERPGGVGDWQPKRPIVSLVTTREAGTDLTPAEARAAARLLLAAADLAEASTDPAGPRRCLDCGVSFAWDESPDDQRCSSCAERHDWNHGDAA